MSDSVQNDFKTKLRRRFDISLLDLIGQWLPPELVGHFFDAPLSRPLTTDKDVRGDVIVELSTMFGQVIRPIICVIDDVQWMSPASAGFIELEKHVTDADIFVILCQRSDPEITPGARTMMDRLGKCTRIDTIFHLT